MLISAWGLTSITSFNPCSALGEPRPESLRRNQPGVWSCGERHLPGTDTIHDGWPRWRVCCVWWWQNILLLHSRNSRHARVQGQSVEARKCYLASNFCHIRAVPTAVSHTFHSKDIPSATGPDFQLEYSRFGSELQVSEVRHNLGIGDHGRAISCQLQLQSTRRGGCERVPCVSFDDEVVETENRVNPISMIFWGDCVQLNVIEIMRRLSRADQPGLWNICRKSVDWLQWQSGEQCV